MLDTGQRRRSGAAFEAGNQDVVGMPFGDTGRNRADADFGHQLHADSSTTVGVLQVEDQLRQVFDRIDVVMRRRTDQVPHLSLTSRVEAIVLSTL
jgi:hypothetical protein